MIIINLYVFDRIAVELYCNFDGPYGSSVTYTAKERKILIKGEKK